jgi:hypothetical protein
MPEKSRQRFQVFLGELEEFGVWLRTSPRSRTELHDRLGAYIRDSFYYIYNTFIVQNYLPITRLYRARTCDKSILTLIEKVALPSRWVKPCGRAIKFICEYFYQPYDNIEWALEAISTARKTRSLKRRFTRADREIFDVISHNVNTLVPLHIAANLIDAFNNEIISFFGGEPPEEFLPPNFKRMTLLSETIMQYANMNQEALRKLFPCQRPERVVAPTVNADEVRAELRAEFEEQMAEFEQNLRDEFNGEPHMTPEEIQSRVTQLRATIECQKMVVQGGIATLSYPDGIKGERKKIQQGIAYLERVIQDLEAKKRGIMKQRGPLEAVEEVMRHHFIAETEGIELAGKRLNVAMPKALTERQIAGIRGHWRMARLSRKIMADLRLLVVNLDE